LVALMAGEAALRVDDGTYSEAELVQHVLADLRKIHGEDKVRILPGLGLSWFVGQVS
jgi:hypothetical protein